MPPPTQSNDHGGTAPCCTQLVLEQELKIRSVSELEFTTNNSKGIEQRTFPTQGVVIGGSGGALGKVGEIDWGRVLHGSQGVTLHQPIPVSGTVVIEESVSGIWDKGEGKNAIIETESKVSLKETHEPLICV